MIAPQVLLSLVFDIKSAAVVDELRALFASKTADPGPFTDLVAPTLAFAGPLIAYSFLIMLTIVVSYFALLHVAVGALRGEPRLSVSQAFWLGLKSTVPAGLIVLFCLFILTLIGQVLIAPAVLIAVMSFVIPVILVAENKGAIKSLWEALTLRYVRRSDFSGWTVLFVLMTLGAVFYTTVALIGLLSQEVLHLDQSLHIGRGAWIATIGHLPFGPLYLVVTLFEAVSTMALLALFPALTTELYFKVVGRREIGQV